MEPPPRQDLFAGSDHGKSCGGICQAFPIRPIRQVRLAPDRVYALDPTRVQIRRPDDFRNAAHNLNPRREHRCRVSRFMHMCDRNGASKQQNDPGQFGRCQGETL